MKGIELSTKRLRLAPLGSQYLQTVLDYAMDAETTKYMYRFPMATREETAGYLAAVELEWEKDTPGYYEFAILYGARHIGAATLYFEGGIGELGWILNKHYWGNGFALEAAAALVRYFSVHMGTSHFMAHCDTENVASYKVMEKLGMVRTGRQGGRRNRAASQDSFEYQYELKIPR